MKQFNVIIAESERENCIPVCLYYLNAANKNRKYSVDIYLVRNGFSSREFDYDNVKVHTVFSALYVKQFNKSHLLNYGISCMKRPFDWMSIVDVDMVYRSDFFQMLDSKDEQSYVICSGRQMDDSLTRLYKQYVAICSQFDIGPVYPGNSQISMSSKILDKFLEIYKEPLYCEEFHGWGGEDSDVSLRASEMFKEGLLKRERISDMWLHMFHPKNSISNFNLDLFENRRSINKDKLRDWIDRNRVPSR